MHALFLHSSCSASIDLCFCSCSKILVISRLNGLLEFLELGNRLSQNAVRENLKNMSLPSMRKKIHSNHSTWKSVINSVSNDVFPCHSCRAHKVTISVLATCKDLVISGSFDNLLKVMKSPVAVEDRYSCLHSVKAIDFKINNM